jgi:hypothetical protein
MLQLESYQQQGNTFSGLVYPSQEVASGILFETKAAGVYSFPGVTH